jgi:hypothetical protein
MDHKVISYKCKYDLDVINNIIFLDLNTDKHSLIKYYSDNFLINDFNIIMNYIIGKPLCFKTDYFINKNLIKIRKVEYINLKKFKTTQILDEKYYIIVYDTKCKKCVDPLCTNKKCKIENKRFDMNYNRSVTNLNNNILDFNSEIYYLEKNVLICSQIGYIYNHNTKIKEAFFIYYSSVYSSNINYMFNSIKKIKFDKHFPEPINSIHYNLKINIYVFCKKYNTFIYDIKNQKFFINLGAQKLDTIAVINSSKTIFEDSFRKIYLNQIIKFINQIINESKNLNHSFKKIHNLYDLLLIIEFIIYNISNSKKKYYKNFNDIINILSKTIFYTTSIKTKKNTIKTSKTNQKIKMNSKSYQKLKLYCKSELEKKNRK